MNAIQKVNGKIKKKVRKLINQNNWIFLGERWTIGASSDLLCK